MKRYMKWLYHKTILGRWLGLALIVLLWTVVQPAYALWQEPTCDPTNDPDICNIAAPINVSPADQTKVGDLTVNGTVQADTGLTLSPGGILDFPNNVVTDPMVSNNLTSSIFYRDTSPGTTDAVDLNSWSASYVPGVEVVGLLPGAAISPIWVEKAGDTMTGTLSMDLTAANVQGIDIKLGNASGMTIVSPSINPTNYPLSIDVQGDAQRGISITTQAPNGNGIVTTANGVNSTGLAASGDQLGVLAYGTSVTNGRGVVATGQVAGVYGEGLNADGVGVLGVASGLTGVGVQANSTQSTGVYGNSGALGGPVNDVYGVIGCRDGANCGKLGGEYLAGRFDDDTYTDGQAVADLFLPTDEQAFGNNSFYPGIKRASFAHDPSKFINLTKITFLDSDGSEVWAMAQKSGGGETQLTRLNAQTGALVAMTDFSGGLNFIAATLGQDGFYAMEQQYGDIWYWNKFRKQPQNIGTIFNSSNRFRDAVQLEFDGQYLWAGRRSSVAPFNQNIVRIGLNPLSGSYTTTPDSLAVLDFVIDGQYVYALVDSTGFGSASSEVWRINAVTNAVDYTWEMLNGSGIDYMGSHMIFDGQSIWVTLNDVSGGSNDGLAQLDVQSQDATFYNLETVSSSFHEPNDIVFDGQYLWITLQPSVVTNNLVRVTPFSENRNTLIATPEFYKIGDPIKLMTFDGEYVWIEVDRTVGILTGTLEQYVSGQGYGNQLTSITRGITLFNSHSTLGANPDAYCLSLKSPTVGGATIADLKLTPDVCPQN